MKLSWPTRLTLLRIFLIIPFVSFMLNINDSHLSLTWRLGLRYSATVIYVFMALTDWLDGYLARHRRQITQLGTFLDPVADKLLITSACLLLVSERGHVEGFLLPPTVVVLIIGKDLFLILGFAIVFLITSKAHIESVLMGKVATGLQFVMVAATLLAPEFSAVVPGWAWILEVLWWSAAGSAIAATLIYIRNGSRYIEAYEQANR